MPQAKQHGDKAAFRLACHFVPRRYDLFFAPRPAEAVFHASAVLRVEVGLPLPSPTRCITLHALDLLIDPAHVTMAPVAAPLCSSASAAPGSAVESHCVAVHAAPTDETITLEFSTELPNEVGAMFLLRFAHFSGVIQSSNVSRGLFFTDTRDTNFLSTLLEPTNARRVFPCFDEPSFRAMFQLTVEFDIRYTIVAGTQSVQEEIIAVEDSDFGVMFGSTPPALQERGRLRAGGYEEERGLSGSSINRMAHTPLMMTSATNTTTTTTAAAVAAASTSTTMIGGAADIATQVSGEDVTSMSIPHYFSESRSHQQQSSLDASGSGHHGCCVRRVTFAETPLLSTSVIGFSTGRFHIVEKETSRRQLLCRVVFPVDMQVNQGWYALDLLTKAVDFFDEYYDFPLPLQKLDLVGLRCFKNLGMENWGMITLHQEYMLVDEETPLERRQRIARLIGHEVAHQWLGNWACIAWWKFLWIKEGFCRYLEFLFVDAVFPSWLIWDEFLSQILDDALALDAQPEKTHPVEYCNDAPRCILRGFDSISYGKGAGILRMLSTLLGREQLRSVIHLLLQRCANTSLDAQILVDCIRQKEPVAERREVAEAALQFALVSGHPMLYIEQSDGVCRVTQYHTPDLRHGILKQYLKQQLLQQERQVRQQQQQQQQQQEEDHGKGQVQPGRQLRQHKGSRSVNLMSPRHTRVLAWNAEKFLQRCNCTVPVSIVELEHGVSSSSPNTILIQKSQETLSLAPGKLMYFNYCGTSVVRCDYDTATWRRIFELSHFLTSEDRMVITMTLFRLLFVHIGQDGSDPADRCTLLLRWLLLITQSTCINASQWKYITKHLERIVYMVRDYHCWNSFSNFVCSLYAPLVLRGTVSFSVQEKTVSFQSQTNLSRHTVLHILQLLAMCRSTMILDDAKEVFEWALASLIPALASGRPASSSYRAVAFDAEKELDAEAACIAMQCLTESGDMKAWWTLTCVLGAIVGQPLESTAEELHCGVEEVHVAHLVKEQKNVWVRIIAPAVFAFDAGSTVPLLANMLKHFVFIDAPTAKAILRNKRLVTWLFEQDDPSLFTPELFSIRQMLVMYGATFCGDGNLMALMKACVASDMPSHGGNCNSHCFGCGRCSGGSSHSHGSNASGCSSGVGVGVEGGNHNCTDAVLGGKHARIDQREGSACLMSAANAIAAVEMNCLWMEYCCDHYHAFLSATQTSQVMITPRAATHGTCAEVDITGRSGVSI